MPVSQLAALYLLSIPDGNALGVWTAHLWTIEVEAKFYVAMPLGALLAGVAVKGLGSLRARALAIAIPAAAWTCMAPFVWTGTVANTLLELSQLFTAGIALAAFEPLAAPLVAGRRRWGAAATALFAAAVAYIMAFPWLYAEVGRPFAGDLGALAVELAVVSLVGASLLRSGCTGAAGGCSTIGPRAGWGRVRTRSTSCTRRSSRSSRC